MVKRASETDMRGLARSASRAEACIVAASNIGAGTRPTGLASQPVYLSIFGRRPAGGARLHSLHAGACVMS